MPIDEQRVKLSDMGVLVGIDVGTKNVGIATANSASPIATPLGTFDRAQHKSEKKILELLDELDVERIIIGIPLGSAGEFTDQCQDILDYYRRLARRTKVEISFLDEHLSSREAEERLIEAGKKNINQQRGVLDKASASIILQTYLDDKNDRVLYSYKDIENLLRGKVG